MLVDQPQSDRFTVDIGIFNRCVILRHPDLDSLSQPEKVNRTVVFTNL